ncbi:MAG: M56 family metallopeptidase [Gemmatimonadaceae bacterium]|nr:M56 family metallopeptidase [Gemmatimonadaceae bacterium]
MSAGWFVYALVIGALIAFATSALASVAQSRRWPTRWLWLVSMAATLLVLAVAARARPAERTRSVAESFAVPLAQGPGSPSRALLAMIGDAQTYVASALFSGVATVARQLPPWLPAALAALWFVATVGALGTLALVHLRLRRARSGWIDSELHGHQVRVAPSEGPAVIGILHPVIVVPRWLLARDADEQRLVLEHEAEHVQARDHLMLLAACVAVACMPWHPATWWSLARLRLAIELDCDARVLRRGTPPRFYGEMLIDLAGQCSGFRVGATALADKTSHLERRLLAMKPITPRNRPLRTGLLCATAALALSAACEARVPTSAEIQSMDVASAERSAMESGLIDAMHGGPPEFYVNGVDANDASKSVARPLLAELHRLDAKIVSVEIIKGVQATQMISDAAAWDGIIKVTTRKGK